MDWGLGNPNETAALIALLMISVWGFVYVRKWGFWVALTLFTGLGVCLVHTFSRGGIVAAGAGLMPLLLLTPRPWAWKRIAASAVAVWVIVGASIYLQANSRYMQGIVTEDRSITHRLDIWKVTPQMMVDAPGGWGLGQASNAYQKWYQPLERGERYLNLISTHLTWLVEIGWGWRFLYIMGWLAVFALCWPDKAHRWLSIPFGIWLAFFVAGIFSHVADSLWMWIVPGISLCIVLIARVRKHEWPSRWALTGSAAASALALIIIYGLGVSHHEWRIRKEANRVIIGQGQPKSWIVINSKIMGENYGKTIRRYLKSSTKEVSMGIVQSFADLPVTNEGTVVVGGTLGTADLDKLKQGTKLVLLNPAFFPQEIELSKSKSVSVLFGEFSQSPALQAWRDLGRVQNVEGKGDFLANWPELVFNASHQE